MKIKSMILISMFSAISVVGAKIQIPSFYGIPITCQFVCAILAGLVLGAKLGAISQALYMFMGIIGLPVFASSPFGGPSYIFKVSFGFVIGFIAAAFIFGLVIKLLQKSSYNFVIRIRFFITAFASLFVVYFFGITYAILLKDLYFKTPISLAVAISTFILPYIITDSIWCIIIGLSGERFYNIRKRFNNNY